MFISFFLSSSLNCNYAEIMQWAGMCLLPAWMKEKKKKTTIKSDHVRFVSYVCFAIFSLDNIGKHICHAVWARAFASGANGERFACLFWTMQSRFSLSCIIAELFFFLSLALCQRERCIDFVLSFLLQHIIIFFFLIFMKDEKKRCKCWVFLFIAANFSTISVFRGANNNHLFFSVDRFNSLLQWNFIATPTRSQNERAESGEFRAKVALIHCGVPFALYVPFLMQEESPKWEIIEC